jgi:hypothetical protein
MIGRMIAPPAQMMLLGRPKFKFLRFQMTVNKIEGSRQPSQTETMNRGGGGLPTRRIIPSFI